MSKQTNILFPIRKKSTFYGSKESEIKEDFTNATLRSIPTQYIPKVKKIVTLSSSESESDSDSENVKINKANSKENRSNDVLTTPRRVRKSDDSEDDNSSSPPKQRKTEKSAEVPLTPSTLLDKLDLSSDEKKEKLNPKKLFGLDKYRNARKALHSSVSDNLPGRETELAKLQEFISEHLEDESSASLYVSGPPGTGKTACLSKIMQQPEFQSKFKVVYVNCTTMKSAATIYSKIIQELGLTVPKSSKISKAMIEKYLISDHKMLLLILDEIDQLESRNQSILYSIFEWPSKRNTKLLLIGIANALDLTDRILPRLQAKCELKPQLLNFPPYTKQQISNILSTRLQEANVPDMLIGPALQLLAGKVAAISGDIRRALDISRRVIELAESHQTSQILQPVNNTTSPRKDQPLSEKPVDVKDVMTVLNGVYGGTQNIDKEESTLPLQQKLLLCSFILILNKGKNKDVTIKKLHEVYKKVCKKRNIHAIDISEFVCLCTLIETRGILRIIKKKEARLSKLSLQWDQEEIGAALEDKNMMAEIINDVSCL
ncbi:PREDICTED: cell division control protein 6 homolog [Polistes dominula]|uniref:Cell division control protein n=1 Tax=Polistes dominula TaxID=743375 RepID=A0ABM1JG60_POLDO|nr:PREDICTED: cell division control protein 6 homolog [Polistes dominula]